MELLQKRTQTQVTVDSFVQSVYNWMAVGLGLTALVAFVVASNYSLLQLMYSLRFPLIIGELALVFILSARIQRMSASTATGLFLFYSALNGATLSVIFVAYTMSSIASTFVVCALTFAGCSAYGWVTKRDLTSLGSFFIMGLIGVVIASLINMFIRSSAMTMIISYVGVLVFVGLTAYDTQKLKDMALSQPSGLDAAVIRKGAIMGALTLYLDFINMFLFLLNILGGRRN